jgi:ATP-binding cassette subfamily F protein 3
VKILIKVLRDYEGSIIIVSHDRYFLSQIANKIWWIEDHQIKEYPGDYEEYEYSRKQTLQAAKQTALKPKSDKKARQEEKPQKIQEDEEQRKLKRKLQQRFQNLESNLEKLKAEKADLEKQLSLPKVYSEPVLFQETLQRFNENAEKLKSFEAEYEQVFESLAGME